MVYTPEADAEISAHKKEGWPQLALHATLWVRRVLRFGYAFAARTIKGVRGASANRAKYKV
jgi:hypothetical protein